MNIEDFRNYCIHKRFVSEEFPFDENTLVYKVAGKMFALTGLNEFASINLKCDPEEAVALREKYPAVQPGYHMSKKHWNTVVIDGSIPDNLIYKWVDDSYDLVIAGLSKKLREELKLL